MTVSMLTNARKEQEKKVETPVKIPKLIEMLGEKSSKGREEWIEDK